jgi:hypothetical protein
MAPPVVLVVQPRLVVVMVGEAVKTGKRVVLALILVVVVRVAVQTEMAEIVALGKQDLRIQPVPLVFCRQFPALRLQTRSVQLFSLVRRYLVT